MLPADLATHHNLKGPTMKPLVPIVALATLAIPGHADAATSTKPVLLSAVVRPYTIGYRVEATVTADPGQTVTLTSEAYRHPVQVEATMIGGGTVSAKCTPTVLPHTWRVVVDGVVVASTSGIKCG
jgi:plastocyanin